MQFLWRECCNFKIARVNQVRFSVRFVAAISEGFRTCLKLDATSARQKLHRVAATKIARVNGPLGFSSLCLSVLYFFMVLLTFHECSFYVNVYSLASSSEISVFKVKIKFYMYVCG